jgi:hypothetical protein
MNCFYNHTIQRRGMGEAMRNESTFTVTGNDDVLDQPTVLSNTHHTGTVVPVRHNNTAVFAF